VECLRLRAWIIRADSGSAGHGLWVNKCECVMWVTGQYRETRDP